MRTQGCYHDGTDRNEAQPLGYPSRLEIRVINPEFVRLFCVLDSRHEYEARPSALQEHIFQCIIDAHCSEVGRFGVKSRGWNARPLRESRQNRSDDKQHDRAENNPLHECTLFRH